MIVKEMNRLGMMVDISHVSSNTMRDVLRVTRSPVIFSHSSARNVNNVSRNVPDDVLQQMVSKKQHINPIYLFDLLDNCVKITFVFSIFLVKQS